VSELVQRVRAEAVQRLEAEKPVASLLEGTPKD